MSVWSPGLYGNDVTADLKNVFRDLVRVPLGTDELIQQLTTIFAGPCNVEDEMYTSFWLATADLLHTYGVDAPLIYTQALDIIASGADLDVHQRLGLSARDQQRRAQELQRLAAKLAQPNPKPRNRRLLAEPEPWLFDEGAVIAYPTRENQPINPYMAKRFLADWVADGWGSFVVLGHDRIYGFLAVYLIAVLPPLGRSEPDLPSIISHRDLTCVAALVTVPSIHPKKMHLKRLGSLLLRQAEIEAHFVPGTPPFDFRPEILANALYMHVPSYPPDQQLELARFVEFHPVAI